jgi:hypothetical protein
MLENLMKRDFHAMGPLTNARLVQSEMDSSHFELLMVIGALLQRV